MRYAINNCSFLLADEVSIIISGPYLDKPKATHTVKVSRAGMEKYNKGELIQNCFPELSPDDREFLISGLSPMGFEKATHE